jgi:hypothetical protein
LLSIITLRNDHLYLAQSGPMHAFLINAAGAKHIHDPQISGRGLGLGRNTPIHYSQADLKPYDTLIISPQPPPTWSAATLSGLHNQPPDNIRHHLLDQAAPTLRAMLFQASRGTGKMTLLHPMPGQPVTYVQPKPEAAQPAAPVVPAADLPEPSTPLPSAEVEVEETTQFQATQFIPPVPIDQASIYPAPASIASDLDAEVSSQIHVPDREAEQSATPSQPKTRRQRRAVGAGRLAILGKTFSSALARACCLEKVSPPCHLQ